MGSTVASREHDDIARPKEFDRAEVLDRAMSVFWEKGYESASLQDLVDHMGIGRASLYDTFGSKRALFGEALDAYSEVMNAEYFCHLRDEGPLDQVLNRFFGLTIDRIMAGDRHGCLMLKAAMATCRDDAELATRVQGHMKQVDDLFRERLLAARDQGQVAPEADVDALARFLTNGLQGLWVRGTVMKDRDCLRDIADGLMATVESHLTTSRA